MRIVSKKKIVDYYSDHAMSKTALEVWYKKVSKSSWENLNDYVGNNRVVFSIKGNNYRLIAIIIYVSQKVYIRWIGAHSEYNKIDAKNI